MARKNGKMMWLSIGCVAALLLSGGALARQFSKETTKELSSYSYTIGAVTDGAIDKEDKSSITSDKLKVKNLVSIELDEDADVKVYVHWYDGDGDWLSNSEVTEDGTPVAPDGAETFRVEIEPTDDNDGEVSALEKGGYAKLVTVTLKK